MTFSMINGRMLQPAEFVAYDQIDPAGSVLGYSHGVITHDPRRGRRRRRHWQISSFLRFTHLFKTSAHSCKDDFVNETNITISAESTAARKLENAQ